jgi:hypothetical protein
MNNRERFRATMHYQLRGYSLFLDFGFWDETFVFWYDQGLPREVNAFNSHEFFGMGFKWAGMASGVDVGLKPPFGAALLEGRGDWEVIRQAWGEEP